MTYYYPIKMMESMVLYPILSLVQCTHVVKLFPNLGAHDFLLHLFLALLFNCEFVMN